MKAVLQFEEAGKSYLGPKGPVQALTGASLSVAAGELVLVQGPSGCGKSTLLLAAGGLLQLDAGRVRVDGQDLAMLSPEARARLRAAKIGFVFQQFHLVPYLSVRDNVMAPALACPAPDVADHTHRLMAQFGLQDRAFHFPSQLSTGERQRTALARALLNRPKILLADEPTGNLDSENGEKVLACLREFANDGGAVLLATHDVSLARHATRRVRLQEGKLFDNG